MKPDFQHLMSQATGLVRQGQLKEAMVKIQASLGHGLGQAQGPGQTGEVVIDIEAREVNPLKDASSPSSAPQGAGRSTDGLNEGGQFLPGSHNERAGMRAYKLYVPPNHQDGPPRPLVVMLHGCTQDPDDFATGTGMNRVAQEEGFFVLYPAQAQSANASRCWSWFKHNHQQRDRGEPAILAGMTRHIIHQHNIDARQVYVAGLSAGGAMAAVLGEAYPDVFAAVGVHSGLPVGAANDVPSALAAMKSGGASRPSAAFTPTIVFHGDRDQTVHPVNGERVVRASCSNVESRVSVVSDVQGRPYTRQVHVDGEGHVLAEHWVVHGAGHAWSGGSAQGSYTDPRGPNATLEMLRFFKAQAR